LAFGRALVALSALLGCSTLPEYAAPKGSVVDVASLDSTNVIGYRQISRADFNGTKAPREFAAVADRVGAATCGQVRTTPDTQLTINWTQDSPQSPRRHWVEVKNLRFVALMNRNCSWWNDKAAAFAPDYVLQHEQIHFALYELGARRLNAALSVIKRDMVSEGPTQEAVQSHAQDALKDALVEATKDIVARNRDFDEDTSLGYRPDRQRDWLLRVTTELAATQKHASPPYTPPP